ncbi:hypothetical protein RhiXN_04343 [Rhizoctonia solani]|uniref:Uncharacterized protein n=1 Tax=Rhizoctonia solani TaxID=456999 RepID=A0A8H8NPC9_9AGAM|nr:uncharacterized protein RhiXN_04343 [Rhizoctonia solani]QRW16342.1 hypothetical protein RhiXN_04343 [Rhizoctonia solani]
MFGIASREVDAERKYVVQKGKNLQGKPDARDVDRGTLTRVDGKSSLLKLLAKRSTEEFALAA